VRPCRVFSAIARPLKLTVRPAPMTPVPQAGLRATLDAYQRDLAWAMLPVLAMSIVVAGLVALAYSHFGARLPGADRTKAIVGFLCVIALVQIPMSYFRRAVRRLSAAHGLVCPSCGAALGFRYATLKRTGKCSTCGNPFPGAV
jgi:hypothetical protein